MVPMGSEGLGVIFFSFDEIEIESVRGLVPSPEVAGVRGMLVWRKDPQDLKAAGGADPLLERQEVITRRQEVPGFDADPCSS
jgi:hypothetical protein